jgi:hypothetical protein
MRHQARVARYREVSGALGLMSDQSLGRFVDGARSLGRGIGGSSGLLEVEGVPVFVKRVPLTDRERRPENVRSTANLFGLPASCHYGIGDRGSPGFGTWRELAANAVTTDWVLAGRSEAFPLMYHWRVLPGAPPPADELADVERAVSYWEGSPGVRERIDALATASACVVLFLEYLPQGLSDWLGLELARGPEAIEAAVAMVERCLRLDLGFLNAHGLVHFDAHFGNVLTDGRRLYFADLGLATSSRFDLTPGESDFLARHRHYDAALALTYLVNWLVTRVCGVGTASAGGIRERNAYVRRCAAGEQVVDAPAGIAATIRRYAPVATVMNAFMWDLFGVSRTTPYPMVEIERAVASAQFTRQSGRGGRGRGRAQ